MLVLPVVVPLVLLAAVLVPGLYKDWKIYSRQTRLPLPRARRSRCARLLTIAGAWMRLSTIRTAEYGGVRWPRLKRESVSPSLARRAHLVKTTRRRTGPEGSSCVRPVIGHGTDLQQQTPVHGTAAVEGITQSVESDLKAAEPVGLTPAGEVDDMIVT